jgi:hypothetical protein
MFLLPFPWKTQKHEEESTSSAVPEICIGPLVRIVTLEYSCGSASRNACKAGASHMLQASTPTHDSLVTKCAYEDPTSWRMP